ncbi:MAG: L-sorbosone dehydrogenase, partial [Proteobacteria bacterium]
MRRFWLVGLIPFLYTCAAAPTEEAAGRLTASAKLIQDSSGYLYDPADRSCDGFPRLNVDTMPGTCLGLVLPQAKAVDPVSKKAFVMPRTLVAIPGTKEFLLVDMGGWKANNGVLFWLKPKADGQYEVRSLKTGLNTPHGLSAGPFGYFYLGESDKISRFHFANGKVADWQLVVAGLPRFKGHMHPLTQFTFDPRTNDMFINSGAPSDHCYVKEGSAYAYCPDSEGVEIPGGRVQQAMGAILRVPAAKVQNPPADGIGFYEIKAQGLRNSMAMVVHSSGHLLQGENARDFSELEEPYEEINVVDLNVDDQYHYGWPYCFNASATSPEWKHAENRGAPARRVFRNFLNCNEPAPPNHGGGYRPPYALMPPHVAPLNMAYLKKPLGALSGGQLLVSWHGYQPAGQRLVAYEVDAEGRPNLKAIAPKETYNANQKGGCPSQKPFRPQGGVAQVAPYTEVISGWDEVKGQRPTGAPVGFTEAADGSIWIAEDRKNRTVVRLAKFNGPPLAKSCGERGKGSQPDPRVELLVWRNIMLAKPDVRAAYQEVKKKLVTPYCAGCHGNMRADDIAADDYAELDFFIKNGWVQARSLDGSKLYQAIAQTGELPPMPPGGSKQFFGTAEGEEILRVVSSWIKIMPNDFDTRFKRSTLKDARKFRVQAANASPVCG